MGSVPSSWRMRRGLGVGEEDLTVDLERWAGLKYTEQVRGTFPLSHWVSKDLVFAQRLKVRVWGSTLAIPRREAGTRCRQSDYGLDSF